MSNPLLPNGRKRRLTPLHKKHRDPTLIPYQPVKRQRANSNAPPNMAHLPGSNNHKMSAGTGGSAGRVGFNNLAKKSNQGKKLVIKNRKGIHTSDLLIFSISNTSHKGEKEIQSSLSSPPQPLHPSNLRCTTHSYAAPFTHLTFPLSFSPLLPSTFFHSLPPLSSSPLIPPSKTSQT